jgi:hypothetical protein
MTSSKFKINIKYKAKKKKRLNKAEKKRHWEFWQGPGTLLGLTGKTKWKLQIMLSSELCLPDHWNLF